MELLNFIHSFWQQSQERLQESPAPEASQSCQSSLLQSFSRSPDLAHPPINSPYAQVKQSEPGKVVNSTSANQFPSLPGHTQISQPPESGNDAHIPMCNSPASLPLGNLKAGHWVEKPYRMAAAWDADVSCPRSHLGLHTEGEPEMSMVIVLMT